MFTRYVLYASVKAHLFLVTVCKFALTYRLGLERDSVERESREKETKILSLNHQLEDLENRLAESERVRAQQQRELDSYANNQDDVGKNVCNTVLTISCVTCTVCKIYMDIHCNANTGTSSEFCCIGWSLGWNAIHSVATVATLQTPHQLTVISCTSS